MPGPTDSWSSRDQKSISRHQQLVDSANENQQITTGDDQDSLTSPGGRGLIDLRRFKIIDSRFARIVAPTDASYTFTDARYQLQVLSPKITDAATDPNANLELVAEPFDVEYPEGGFNGYPTSDTTNYDVGNYVIGINWAECTTTLKSVDGSHNLVEDGKTIVMAVCAYDREDPAQPHWFFMAVAEAGGQYQFMVKQKVTQNKVGYDFVRAHPML